MPSEGQKLQEEKLELKILMSIEDVKNNFAAQFSKFETH